MQRRKMIERRTTQEQKNNLPKVISNLTPSCLNGGNGVDECAILRRRYNEGFSDDRYIQTTDHVEKNGIDDE